MTSANTAANQRKPGSLWGRFLFRFFLCLFTALILLVGASALMLNQVFSGPSPAARELLISSLLEDPATSWIPGVFAGDDVSTP